MTKSDTGIRKIVLWPVSLELREVEIVAMTPQEVLHRARKNIPSNYGTDSVTLTAFIRSQKTVNNRLAEFAEAIVEDMKEGYEEYPAGKTSDKYRHSNVPLLHKGRVVSDTLLVNLLGEVGSVARCLGCFYQPSFKAYPLFEKGKSHRTWYLNNRDGWIQEMPMGETTVIYSKRGETWSLNTIRSQMHLTFSHPQSRQKINYGLKTDVVVTQVSRDSTYILSFRGDKSLGTNQRWDQLVGEPDETFWENFNYLPIEENLKKDLKLLHPTL